MEHAPDSADEDKTGHSIADALERIEDDFLDEVAKIERAAPGPLAPLDEQIKYRLDVAKVRAAGEVITEIYQTQENRKSQD
jgi:hypothetical protein